MGKKEEIRAKLAELASLYGPANTLLAKVKSVNEAEFTCVLEDDDDAELVYDDVRLRPVLDGNESVTLVPKIGTWALAIRMEDDEDWMLLAAGEMEKIIMKANSKISLKVGDREFTIDSKFLVKKGTETLKKIMDDTLDAIQQLTVNTNVGPSSVPINAATFAAIKTRISNFLS